MTIVATGFTKSFQESELSDPRGVKLPGKTSASLEGTRTAVTLDSLTTASGKATRKLFF